MNTRRPISGVKAAVELAEFTFPIQPHESTSNFVQGRIDYQPEPGDQFFGRYTFDEADQHCQQIFHSFRARSFGISSSPPSTGRHVGFDVAHISLQLQPHAHWPGVESNTSPDALRSRRMIGNIDIGGFHASVRRAPSTCSSSERFSRRRRRGATTRTAPSEGRGARRALSENMVNPTFASASSRLRSSRPFCGTGRRVSRSDAEARLDRYWRFTLFGGTFRTTIGLSAPDLNGGLRTSSRRCRWTSMAAIGAHQPGPAPTWTALPEPDRQEPFAARWFAWDIFGDGKHVAARRLRDVLQHEQSAEPDRDGDESAGDSAHQYRDPRFRSLRSTRVGNTIRPVQWNSRIRMCMCGTRTCSGNCRGHRGDARLCGLPRQAPAAQQRCQFPTPTRWPTARFLPAGVSRPNTAFSTIELKTSDGDSWYNALIFEVRKRWTAVSASSRRIPSRAISTRRRLRRSSPMRRTARRRHSRSSWRDYNKGLGLHAKHNWVMNSTWEIPFARGLSGSARHCWMAGTCRYSAGAEREPADSVRAGQPVALAVDASLGPGIGSDRPSYAPGRDGGNAVLGSPEQCSIPRHSYCSPRARSATPGRVHGAGLQTVDVCSVKAWPCRASRRVARLELRIEAFNIFNPHELRCPA